MTLSEIKEAIRKGMNCNSPAMKDFAKRTVLDKGVGAFGQIRTLVHSTAGLEIAGSGTRETEEKWGSLWSNEKQSTNGGKWFATRKEAKADFLKWTQEIVCIDNN